VDKHTGEVKTLQELVRDLKMMPRPSTPTKITQIHAPVVDLNPIYARVSCFMYDEFSLKNLRKMGMTSGES
jgi:hypothetical protein